MSNIDFDQRVDEPKPNRCRCKGKALLKQDKKTGKYYVICRECLTRTEKFESSSIAVEVWNNSAGKKFEPLTAAAPYVKDRRRYCCDHCGYFVGKFDKYCPGCGRLLTDWSEKGRAKNPTPITSVKGGAVW